MKVIVCFGDVKVLIPCGDGQILVRDLMDQCRLRYTKFTNRNDPDNIKVQYLTVAEYGGILDPDDKLADVIDDKEQLVAQFIDLTNGNAASQAAREPTPTASKQDAQPSVVSADEGDAVKPQAVSLSPPVVDVTDGTFPLASEPNDSQAAAEKPQEAVPQPTPAAPHEAEPSMQDSVDGLLVPALAGPNVHAHSTSQPVSLAETERFGRSVSGRKSLGAPSSARSPTFPHEAETTKRSEVLASTERVRHVRIVNNGRQLGIQVVPYYDEVQHVELGFEVDAVIEGKRVHSEKLLSVGDRIVAVNGRSLSGLQYEIAQDIFCKALRQPVLELDVIELNETKVSHGGVNPPQPISAKPPQPVGAKPPQPDGAKPSQPDGVMPPLSGGKHIIELVKTAESLGFSLFVNDSAPRKAETEIAICVKNVVAGGVAHRDGRLRIGDRLLEVNGVDVRSYDQTQLVALLRAAPLGSLVRIVVWRALDTASSDVSAGARTPGSARRSIPTAEVLQFDVPLDGVTQTLGLGINVKARALQVQDAHAGASRDLGIFVNGLVDGGAAQRDGRLRIDDRLIEVNGTSLLNHSNAEAMSLLKSAIGENAGRSVCSITIIRTSNAETLSGLPDRDLDAEAEAAADLIYAATVGASRSSSADIDAITNQLATGLHVPHTVEDPSRTDRKIDAKLPDLTDARQLPSDETVSPSGPSLNVNLQPPNIPVANANDPPRNLEMFSLRVAASSDIPRSNLHADASTPNSRLPTGSGNMQAQAQLQSQLLTQPQVQLQPQLQMHPQAQFQPQAQIQSQPQARLQPQTQNLSQPQLQAQLQQFPLSQPQVRLQSQPQTPPQLQGQPQPQMQWPPPLSRDNTSVAPLQLDPDVAMQLAKIRGSAESFRLAVDRSHEGVQGHTKPDRKAEKQKKADKADKAEKQKTAAHAAEHNASSSGHRKKKKHGESAGTSDPLMEARVDEPPGAAQPALPPSTGPNGSAQLDLNVTSTAQLPSTDVMQQPRLPMSGTAAPSTIRPPMQTFGYTPAIANPYVRTSEMSATNLGAPSPSAALPSSSAAVRSAAPPPYRQPQPTYTPAPPAVRQMIPPGYALARPSAPASRPLSNAVPGSAFAPYTNSLAADGRQLPGVSVQVQVQAQR